MVSKLGLKTNQYCGSTTHLELIKRVSVGSLWQKGKKQKIAVLKAKVLLESSLDMEAALS